MDKASRVGVEAAAIDALGNLGSKEERRREAKTIIISGKLVIQER